ncbi:hypothetical protein [Sphingomonas sp. CFBP 8765]|uniref:hypothetical protein n=1 Tax=Sphingomonas sp. CFBP 8765 TaxID=2775274 RepID=UPI001783AAAD|nr:hypothetical protein [Sphingomonas sp. CFBP 8765]MBD8469211.1 hypothetical protein [Sphingomonas sp. CFBP 8765]
MKKLVTLLIIVSAAAPVQSQVSDGDPPLIVESLPEHLGWLKSARKPTGTLQQLHAADRLWNGGDTLQVCFFGGNAVVKTLISTVASEWSKYANIRFDFGTPGKWRDCRQPTSGLSSIRIGFSGEGYWSLIGLDAQDEATVYQPSMNFESFSNIYNPNQGTRAGIFYTPANVVQLADARDRGTILHEFGHALGLLHEHQNPVLGCQAEIIWTGPGNVYDYYGRNPNSWDRETVDRNLGPIAAADPDAKAGDPDPDSIMMYAQPAAIFRTGKASRCYVIEKNIVSAKDQALVARLYPAGAKPPSDDQFTTTTTVAGRPAAALTGRAVTPDALERILVDLDSENATARRGARRELALQFEEFTADRFAAIVDATKSRSYRQQLGVAVAVDRSAILPKLTTAQASTVRSRLKQIEANTKDVTLRTAADRALSKLGLN